MPAVLLPPPFSSVGAYVAELSAFLEAHAWLFRHHVVDFVTHDHWQHVPEAWRAPLLGCSAAELSLLPVGVCPPRAMQGAWVREYALISNLVVFSP